MRKISLDKLDQLFAEISSKSALYIPVDTAAGAKFEKYDGTKKMSDALNTVRSAKDFFFPQTENLVDFKVEGKTIEIKETVKEDEDFVVFGVRACDVKSFEILDRVFLADPVDNFYKNRRDHGIIVSMACTRPAETCFCQTFGIDATAPAGDIECHKTTDAVYLEAKTDKGAKLLKSLNALTEDADASAVEAQKAQTKEVFKKLPLAGLDASAFGDGKTNEFFNAPEWKTLSESCLGCGTCTFVCPTCQCYDIKDFNTGHEVKRFRCWDSCMYSDFTRMAHGNPRLTQVERFRQRFMHKLVYYPTNNEGIFGCVGCGRCMAKCPINMNIVKVMKKLGGNK
ncbi:MAG: 4Fe-4S dicluster domain-containing protein [Oscillospiraceae bacterium]|nr:4Fe-4S dicluster domain-containing protein [Oscillospiraceae bacterium]